MGISVPELGARAQGWPHNVAPWFRAGCSYWRRSIRHGCFPDHFYAEPESGGGFPAAPAARRTVSARSTPGSGRRYGTWPPVPSTAPARHRRG